MGLWKLYTVVLSNINMPQVWQKIFFLLFGKALVLDLGLSLQLSNVTIVTDDNRKIINKSRILDIL